MLQCQGGEQQRTGQRPPPADITMQQDGSTSTYVSQDSHPKHNPNIGEQNSMIGGHRSIGGEHKSIIRKHNPFTGEQK